ncbi:MAG TPA: formate dehydrogenase subunit alpha, partial [Desulfovibrio sp.]|nr:formate dehydrogenase subunit alpha [Desulfovibrio sp.]
HTATMTRRCFGLAGTWPEELVEIHPADAAKYSIVDGELVEVSSRRGIVKARAWVTERVRRGLIFMTFHFSESPANLLTTSAADPVTGTPQLKVCAVSVRKFKEPEDIQVSISIKEERSCHPV